MSLLTPFATLSRYSEDTAAFPWAKRTPIRGLTSVLAIGIALLLGHLTGHRAAGSIAAGAAFTVGFAVFHEALASTLLSMALLTLGVASATLIGSLGAEWTPVVLLLVVVASVNYGLLSEFGPTSGWIGQQCGVFVIISSYFSHGPHYAVGRAAMVLLGGALQMAVFAVVRLAPSATAWKLRSPRTPGEATLAHRLRARLTGLRSLRRQWLGDRDTTLYILRLAITLLLSTLFYRYEHLGNGYWAPMTALLVLKPQWSSTLSRGIARLTGTLVGAAVALLVALYLPITTPVIVTLVLVTAWTCFALQAVNYALFCLFLTLYTVFSFRFGGFSQPAAAHLRLLNTAIGGAIALLVDAFWKLGSHLLRRRNALTVPGTPATQSVQ